MRPLSRLSALLLLTASFTTGCGTPEEWLAPSAYFGFTVEFTDSFIDRELKNEGGVSLRFKGPNDAWQDVASVCAPSGESTTFVKYEGYEAIEGDKPLVVGGSGMLDECGLAVEIVLEVNRVEPDVPCPQDDLYSPETLEVDQIEARTIVIEEDAQMCESVATAKFKALPGTPELERPEVVAVVVE